MAILHIKASPGRLPQRRLPTAGKKGRGMRGGSSEVCSTEATRTKGRAATRGSTGQGRRGQPDCCSRPEAAGFGHHGELCAGVSVLQLGFPLSGTCLANVGEGQAQTVQGTGGGVLPSSVVRLGSTRDSDIVLRAVSPGGRASPPLRDFRPEWERKAQQNPQNDRKRMNGKWPP